MPWHVAVEGSTVRLQEVGDLGVIWSGTVVLHAGAPDFGHPELRHAMLAVAEPEINRPFVRHRWTYEVPASVHGVDNTGSRRMFMVLRSQGAINWTLTLRLPYLAPRSAYQAIARGFGATPLPLPKKEKTLKPTNDNTAKTSSLPRGDVPEAKSPPPEFKEGVQTVVAPKD